MKIGKVLFYIHYNNLNYAYRVPIADNRRHDQHNLRYERMSSMDSFSFYNQIKMHHKDKEHTAFGNPIRGAFLHNDALRFEECRCHLPKGHYCCLPQSFLEGSGRLCVTVKIQKKEYLIHDMRTIFNIMRTHQPKMNPTKLFLGVSSGKFLGFIVNSRGIHVDLEKV